MSQPTSTKRTFKPTLIPTLMTIPAIILMVGLGVWQLERLAWKEGLIEMRESRMNAAPVTDIAKIKLPGDTFRRVSVTGTFLHDKEMYLVARSLRGNVGYHITTPLRLADGSIVMVNRGWVPSGRKEASARAEGQVAGEVTITGIIRGDDRRGWFTPDNAPHDNTWFTVTSKEMAASSGLDNVRPWHVVADEAKNPGGFPIGGQRPPALPNNHLQYVITWFSLAATLAVIWFLYHWRKPEDHPVPEKQGPAS